MGSVGRLLISANLIQVLCRLNIYSLLSARLLEVIKGLRSQAASCLVRKSVINKISFDSIGENRQSVVFKKINMRNHEILFMLVAEKPWFAMLDIAASIPVHFI